MNETIVDLFGNTDEEAKPLPGYSNYFVTNMGQVISTKSGIAVIKKQVKHKNGYLYVSISNLGKAQISIVHRLVLKSFLGECPDGCNASHLNGNRCDNRLSNLVWEANQKNIDRRKQHGTHRIGTQTNSVKLKECQVVAIRNLLASGVPQIDISKKFNVHKGTIHCIAANKSWRHI